MKDFIDEVTSDFRVNITPNTDLVGSVFILEETKKKLETNFFLRNFKVSLLFILEIGFLLSSMIILFGGMYYVSYYTGYLSGFSHLDKEFSDQLMMAKVILYFIVFAAAFLLFIASRIFKRSRNRVALLKGTVDNIAQVIVNLKEVPGR